MLKNVPASTINLLKGMLEVNPDKRMSAEQALASNFFIENDMQEFVIETDQKELAENVKALQKIHKFETKSFKSSFFQIKKPAMNGNICTYKSGESVDNAEHTEKLNNNMCSIHNLNATKEEMGRMQRNR